MCQKSSSPVTYVTISLVKIKITLIKLEKNGKIIYENQKRKEIMVI